MNEILLRAAIALALLAAVAALALHRRRRRERAWEPAVPALAPGDLPTGARAPLTAVYFTSRLCHDCRDTPRVVRDAAPEVPALAMDVRERAELVRRLDVFETPTLLLVDARGRIRYAHVGNPEPAELWTYAREAWDSLEMEGELERDPGRHAT